MSKLIALSAFLVISSGPVWAARPNVLIVITDDQGYGDLGCHGNPVLKTPNLDAFARSGVQLTHFCVSPVCSPTRSSLLTGRYHYRTGVVDTFVGRSMMHADEMTLAEMLRAAGYRTGLFGKWHLGDNYPLRPQDQGFDEVLMHRGGGIAQPSDPPGGNSYTDPVLFLNGAVRRFTGYVTDVFTDAAISFITTASDRPFFSYVAFNCPHAPYQVRDEDWKEYRGIDLGADAFPKVGSPWVARKDKSEDIGRAYGMIANIDRNFGRLLDKVPENTLVIFLTDNGPGGPRWNAGLRNRKGTVYEGGVRVPFYARWKGRLPEGRKVDTPAAHIDVTPTVLEACGVPLPKGVSIDGRSLLPLLTGDKVDWADRHLFFQWHRGDVPEMGRAFAARGPRYKLVQAAGVQVGKYAPKYELFDIPNDRYEQTDLAADRPDVVRDLRAGYEAWFADVKRTRDFVGPRIHVGNDRENPTVLTRQDWRGPSAGWGAGDLGYWDLMVERAGTYRITLDFEPAADRRTATIQFGPGQVIADVPTNATRAETGVKLDKGVLRLQARMSGDRPGVKFAVIERIRD